jgi:hypothetical protein
MRVEWFRVWPNKHVKGDKREGEMREAKGKLAADFCRNGRVRASNERTFGAITGFIVEAGR